MTDFTIRQVQGEELLTTSFPLSEYAFQSTPPVQSRLTEWQERLPNVESYTFLVGFEGVNPVASVCSIPMPQAVRGKIYPMIGIAGVCSHPSTRRKGYVRLLLQALLAAGRADHAPFAGLYPFRESFYERLGFITFPQMKITRFAAPGLAPLLKYELPGEVERLAMIDHLDVYQTFLDEHQPAVHGLARFPAVPEEARQKRNPLWLAVARVNDEVVGLMTYKIVQYGG
ncbi:MAG: GNAT family N-acetyltransferase, partial [Anaerolineae bacterium]|nr:GNAT family N-acetyltransferase [Anaerolineae bacterium]